MLLRCIRGKVNVHSLSCINVSFIWVRVDVGEGRIGDKVRCSIDVGGGSEHSKECVAVSGVIESAVEVVGVIAVAVAGAGADWVFAGVVGVVVVIGIVVVVGVIGVC